MTKRQILNIIKVTLLVSIVGGIIWVKTREAEINRKWNNPEYQEKLRKQLSENKDLFYDKDFNVNFTKPNNLNFRATLNNPFNEIIEKSQLSLRIVLTYKKGTIKYVNKTIEEPEKTEVIYRSKEDWEIILELNGYKYDDGVILDKDGKFIENVKINGKIYSSGISEKDYNDLMEAENIYQERKAKEEKIEEEKRSMLNAFREDKNFVFNYNHNANFDLREDFELYTKDSTDIKNIPTINLFKVENATLEVYLKASNTNGFNFDDKVKSIDITDKWNNHFVSKKDNKEQAKEIYNALTYKAPYLFEQGNSKIDSIIGLKNDIFGKSEVKIAKSELVFKPKNNNANLTQLPDNTEINIRYSKNIFSKKLPNWNQRLSSESIESIIESTKKALNSYHRKTKSNLKLNWLTTERGKINGNVYTKLTYLTKTEDDNETTEISYYIFFNVYENVIITYSRNVNNKPKWDEIFLESLETFDFKNKK